MVPISTEKRCKSFFCADDSRFTCGHSLILIANVGILGITIRYPEFYDYILSYCSFKEGKTLDRRGMCGILFLNR
jgi:hypothetical protein